MTDIEIVPITKENSAVKSETGSSEGSNTLYVPPKNADKRH